jgi:hypothetical protein
MMSRAWAVLVACGFCLGTPAGRSQDGGVPLSPTPEGDPAAIASDPAACPTAAPRRPVRDLLSNLCARRDERACELCPKGHDWKGWLSYHSEARAICAWSPCCPPPLYTFFLNPGCENGPPTAPSCSERKGGRIDGHHLRQLLFWRHAEKAPVAAASEFAADQMADAAPAPVANPQPETGIRPHTP